MIYIILFRRITLLRTRYIYSLTILALDISRFPFFSFSLILRFVTSRAADRQIRNAARRARERLIQKIPDLASSTTRQNHECASSPTAPNARYIELYNTLYTTAWKCVSFWYMRMNTQRGTIDTRALWHSVISHRSNERLGVKNPRCHSIA